MISSVFGSLMNFIYQLVGNYGITIILFTIFTKIVLFPLSIFIQKNSIKMVKMKPKIDELKMRYSRDRDSFMEAQIDLFEKEKYHPSLGVIPLLIQIPIILGLIQVVKNPYTYIPAIHKVTLFSINLGIKPSGADFYIMPILAAFTTTLLWVIENQKNVLQKEQSAGYKLLTGLITIGLTVYLVFLVPNGVGLYWIIGNVCAIVQLYILNKMFPPEKYVDYAYLNKIKEQKEQDKWMKKQSKAYYKMFFERENIDNMHLVFYSEQSGFYKYFKGMIEYILENSDIVIHYVTSDIHDKVFEMKNPRLIPYYIATNQLIPLFMKLEADVVVMTTPDLQNLYLKRSMVRKDIEYIYTDHAITSINLMYRNGALDHFDTIFVTGQNQIDEIQKIEKFRKTKEKNIVKTGYCLLDDMVKNYVPEHHEKKNVLIAPSWQDDNIMDLCIEDILDCLLGKGYCVTLRPHPQYMRYKSEELERLAQKYDEKNREDFVVQRDFSSNREVLNADILITDWSGIRI